MKTIYIKKSGEVFILTDNPRIQIKQGPLIWFHDGKPRYNHHPTHERLVLEGFYKVVDVSPKDIEKLGTEYIYEGELASFKVIPKTDEEKSKDIEVIRDRYISSVKLLADSKVSIYVTSPQDSVGFLGKYLAIQNESNPSQDDIYLASGFEYIQAITWEIREACDSICTELRNMTDDQVKSLTDEWVSTNPLWP